MHLVQVSLHIDLKRGIWSPFRASDLPKTQGLHPDLVREMRASRALEVLDLSGHQKGVRHPPIKPTGQ